MGVGPDPLDGVGNPRLAGGRSRAAQIAQYFNTAAFVPNAIGTFGTLGIDTLRGPGFYNADFSVGKTFQIPYSEKHSIQLRGEFFNLLNQPSFSNPSATLAASGTFGTLLS